MTLALVLAACSKGSPIEPTPTRPWAGTIAVSASTIDELGKVTIDGVAQPVARNVPRVGFIDTTRLSNGTHHVVLESASGPFSRVEEADVTIQNAPAPASTTRFEPWPLLPAGSGAGLEGERTESGAIAADLDGDGLAELFAWERGRGQVKRLEAGITRGTGPVVQGVVSAAAGDLDGDGDLDLVTVGHQTHFLRNDGTGLLEEAPVDGIPGQDPAFTAHAVGLHDLDDDGRLDVSIGEMSCNAPAPSRLLRNDGAWRFVDIAPALGLAFDRSAVFSYAIDPVVAGGGLHLWPLTENCQPMTERPYYRLLPGDDLPNVAPPTAPGSTPAYGGMGSALFDADGDGVLDHFVTKEESQLLLRGPDFVDNLAPTLGLGAMPDTLTYAHNQWTVALFDADLDGLDELLVTQSPLPSTTDPAILPRLHLFKRAGPGPFRETGVAAGLGEPRRCMAVQAADLDGDGDADLLAACANGIETWRNAAASTGLGRTIRLRGTLSNPAGIGARISVAGADTKLVRGGGQPFLAGESAPMIRAPEGTPITVLWPSGLVSTTLSGSSGVVTIEEPRIVALSATERRPGGDDVELVVDPSRGGAAGAAVTATLSGAEWRAPPRRDSDGIWRASIATPSSPANVRVRVVVGELALNIRPRIVVR